MNEFDIQSIDNQVSEIQDGTRNLPQFNQPEHAGVCSAGPLLIGAIIVCNIVREGFKTGQDVGNCQTFTANWEIDEKQELCLQKWAEQKGVWIPEAEGWLENNYGPELAHGAEAKVFCKKGDTHVIKLRTSIYSTLGRALEAIALHNYLFPETIMRVTGFTRDAEGLFRVVLTQPYIECLRLATKKEIDEMLSVKGFIDNGDTTEVNYVSDRLNLEDMHPANVFVECFTSKPICIDCIVRFRK